MGCAASKPDFVVVEDKELREYLSNEDIRLIQETWFMIQDDLDYVGLHIFKRLFAQNKRIKKLFQTKLQAENSVYNVDVGDLEFDDGKVQVHGRIVMEAIGAAVECLEDSDQLSVLLIGIGERHVMYGVHQDMIPLLWPALMSTLKEQIGQTFTEQVGSAWEHLFQYIGSKVIEGIGRWRTSDTP